MNNQPTYYASLPAPESGGNVLSVFLRRAACNQAPEGGREFFEAVLAAIGIDVQQKAWGVHPFFTRYFTGREWEECWEAKIILAHKLPRSFRGEVENIPIFALPATESAPEQYLPVRVLADFTSPQALVRCRDALRLRAAKAMWNEVHYERYKARNIGAKRKQLVVDVITIERSRLPEVMSAAEEAISICEQFGGSTHA